MSNFDENVVNKIKRLEHDIERLKVGERPATNPTLRVGAGSYATVTAALAVASDGDTIKVDAGTYAGFTLYPKQFIHIEGSGQPEFNPTTGLLVGGTIITGTINLFDSVGSSLNNLGVEVSTGNDGAVDTGSLVQNEQHRLNQRFTHLTLNCNPSTNTGTNAAHCFRSQGGSYLTLDDIRTYGGAHGIAIRASWVNITNCYVEDGLFTAIIVKAIPLTGDAEFVNISDIVCNNTRNASGGGIRLQVWDGSNCRFININNVNVYHSSDSALLIDRCDDILDNGIIEHINVNNVTSFACLSFSPPFLCKDANYITFANCRVVDPVHCTTAFENQRGNYVCATNCQRYPATLIMAGIIKTTLDLLSFGSPTTLTISGGHIANITRSYHKIDTEGNAATDNLTNIDGGEIGDILLLGIVSYTRVVTVVHDVNLLNLKTAANVVLGNVYSTIMLRCMAAGVWTEISGADASVTPTASTIPIADGAGKLAVGWMPTTIDADTIDGYHMQCGTVNLTVASGTRNAAGSAITFPTAFTTILGVFLTVEEMGVFAAAEMPFVISPINMTNSTFYPQIFCFANVAADRTASVRWMAIGA